MSWHCAHAQRWPKYDQSLVTEALVNVVLQLNGSLVGVVEMTAAAASDKAVVEATVCASELYKARAQRLRCMPLWCVWSCACEGAWRMT
jgi:leucyl-tRNA synthetase